MIKRVLPAFPPLSVAGAPMPAPRASEPELDSFSPSMVGAKPVLPTPPRGAPALSSPAMPAATSSPAMPAATSSSAMPAAISSPALRAAAVPGGSTRLGVLQELYITTGGPLGDPHVWREHPIAVDGWVCIGCGIFRYPRPISPDRITALSDEGVAHGRAGRIAEAEACFARIAWDWPGYAPGHVNYATALLDRLHDEKDVAARRQLTSHVTEQCDAAVDAFMREPTPPTIADVLAGACMRVAEAAIHDRAYDRAARYAKKAHELPGISDDVKANAAEGQRYLATKRYLFEEASKVYGKRIALSDRRALPPTSPEERAQIMRALEDLREHLQLDRDRWQSVWLYAKGLHLVAKDAEALEVWRDAFARFPDARDLARDYGHELIAKAVKGRLARYRAGAALPRTLRELERR